MRDCKFTAFLQEDEVADCGKMFLWLLHVTVFTKQVQSCLQQLLPALSGAFVDNWNQI